MSVVKNLSRDFGDFKLDIPHWEIADQGITVLWGPSGAGKSSLFRVLLGLEPCPSLSWVLAGQDLALLAPPQRRLGVVFQTLELFPHMTARENILFAARARKVPAVRADKHLNELSELLHLKTFLGRRAELLSGGEKQRVALARALMGEPRFLLLDEPFSSLDQELKIEARKLLRQVLNRHPVPTLLITHDPEDLRQLADHHVEIRGGRLCL